MVTLDSWLTANFVVFVGKDLVSSMAAQDQLLWSVESKSLVLSKDFTNAAR